MSESVQPAAPGRPGTVSPSDRSALEPVAETPIADIAGIVARAREAHRAWARRQLEDRADVVRALGQRILERRAEVSAILTQEMGRSDVGNLFNELVGVGDFVAGAIAVARRALAVEKVALSPVTYPGKKAFIEAVPRGVVGIIAPWNYPLANFYKHLFPALLAGNGVVLKPSEHTPRTGQWLFEQCQVVLPGGLVGLVQGGGAQGQALLEAGIDSVCFTGSTATGRKVSAQAGERLIPATVELGGVDGALVLADCDLDRTIAGVASFSLFNAGQDCSSIERVYIEEAVYDAFTKKMAAFVSGLSAGATEDDDIGPLQNERQLEIVRDHVEDARAKGARVLAGGEACGQGLAFQPTVLADCTDEMKIFNEETFGPVVACSPVKDAEEGIRKINAVGYGLNGSVWTRNLGRGESIARRLEVGVALVNNHSLPGILPGIPWTGVKNTGPGVANSTHAYPAYVRRRTLFLDKNKNPDPWWLPVDGQLQELGELLVRKALGGGLGVLLKLGGLVGKRVKVIKDRIAG